MNNVFYIYLILVLAAIILGAITLGYTLSNIFTAIDNITPITPLPPVIPADTVSYSSIMSISAAITIFGVSLAILFAFLMTAGLASVTDTTAHSVVMVIGGAILCVLNIVVLVYAILVFSNYSGDMNKYKVAKTLQMMAILTAGCGGCMFTVFVFGFVNTAANNNKYRLF